MANKPRGYWEHKDNCHNAAISCSSRSEFEKKYPQAYRNACEWKLLDKWIPSKRAERTYKQFMEIAKGCSTKGEVKKKDASLYAKAREKGWFNDCQWISKHAYSPYKWTDEKRWEAALQCKTRSEYRDRFVGAYTYDNDHGLLDRYTHFVKPIAEGRDPNAEDYVIYAYRDYENKAAYIGLTYEGRKEQRHKEHVYGRKEKDGTITFDAVAKHWKNIGKTLPEPTYVMDELHINDVGYYEDWYRKRYEDAGWNVLNIAECGGLGGAKVKWNTYESVAEKSKEYKTRSEFCHKCSQAAKKAYHTFTKDGVPWINTFTWLRDSHEVRSEAAKKRMATHS